MELAEIPFEVMVSNIDETFPAELTASQVAMHIAENKAMSVQNKLTNRNGYTIISADTVVTLKKEILNKPVDREEAIRMLTKLSGKTHKVTTGVCLLSASDKVLFAEQTEVEFLPLFKEQIEYYVDRFKPYDKAGAYAIQEWIGAIGIKSIKGDFYNVMGLPVSRLIAELKNFGS